MSSYIKLTAHAINRFQQRIVPDLPYKEAEALLKKRIAEAAPLKTKSINGQQLWKITDPEAVLITKKDRGSVAVVVTILDKAEEIKFMEMFGGRNDAPSQFEIKRQAEELINRLKNAKHNYDQEVAAAYSKIEKANDKYRALVKEAVAETDSCEEAVQFLRDHGYVRCGL